MATKIEGTQEQNMYKTLTEKVTINKFNVCEIKIQQFSMKLKKKKDNSFFKCI